MGKRAKKKAQRAAKTDPALDPALVGHPRNGERFTPDRRDDFIKKIEEGASKLHACRLVGISKQSVQQYWVTPGRTESATPEQRDFVERLDAALTNGLHKNTKKLHESNDPRCVIEIQRARDSRFGDLDLRRRKMRVEIRRAEIDAERAAEQLRAERARADVQEALAEKAKGKGQEIAFGLAAILADETLPESTLRDVAEWAVRRGYVLVRGANLAGADGSSPQG